MSQLSGLSKSSITSSSFVKLSGIVSVTIFVYFLISYLYIDDRDLLFPLDHTLRYPLPENAEESYSVLMQLNTSKSEDPESEYQKNRNLIYTLEALLTPETPESDKEQSEEVPEYSLDEKLRIISENKESVNILWKSVESNRRVLDQLHRFKSIADLDPLTISLDFSVSVMAYLNLARVHNYKALLLISENKDSEAIRILVRFIETTRQFMPHTRQTIYGLSCLAVEFILIESLTTIIPSIQITIEERKRLSLITTYPYDSIELMERWTLAELITLRSAIHPIGPDIRNLWGAPKVMPNDSMNQLARFYQDHFKLLRAGKRQAANEQFKKYSESSEHFHLRNPLGRQYFSTNALQPSKFLNTFEKLESKIKEARKALDQSFIQ